MTQRERDRLVALHKADKRLITRKQAAQRIGLSERQVRRLLAKLRGQGDQAVVHAARGRCSNRCAFPTVKAGACSQLPAQQGGIGEHSNTKPSDAEARGSCRSAACFGASPVASALGSEHRRDPPPREPPLCHRLSSHPAKTGHFYSAENRTFLLGVDTCDQIAIRKNPGSPPAGSLAHSPDDEPPHFIFVRPSAIFRFGQQRLDSMGANLAARSGFVYLAARLPTSPGRRPLPGLASGLRELASKQPFVSVRR